MSGRFRLFWIGCLLVLALMPAAAQSAIVFAAADCPFQVPPGQVTDCGYLIVPEDYRQPASRQLRLAVAIFRHPNGNPEPDPIIYLEGGPGGSALKFAHLTFAGRYKPLFAANRDIIIFDQRGVGLSEPALNCPDYTNLILDLVDLEQAGISLTRAESEVRLQTTLMQCGATLSAQHDLSQYNSVVNARDIESLRQALGYEQVNLWGISYGTRLALTMMRDYPEAIRSVVLDATYPLDVNLFTDTPASWSRALSALFAACAADDACNTAFPNLRETFFATVERLNAEPVRVRTFHPLTGDIYADVVLDGALLLEVTFQLLYDTNSIPAMPQMMVRASEGDYSGYALAIGRLLVQQEIISIGMNYAVQCQEELAFAERGTIRHTYEAQIELQSFLLHGIDGESDFDICDNFNAGSPLPFANDPVTSELPTLIFAGAFDPITPPHWGQQVQGNLSNSFYFEFPTIGHGATNGQACPQRIAAAFFVNPSSAPDTSCADDMQLRFIGTNPDPLDFAPVLLSDYGIEAATIIPSNWQEHASIPGMFLRRENALDVTLIQFSTVPGVRNRDALRRAVLRSFNMTQTVLVQTVETDYAQWRIYRIALRGNDGYAAVAVYEDSGVLIMMLGTEHEKNRVLVPMLEVFAPIRS